MAGKALKVSRGACGARGAAWLSLAALSVGVAGCRGDRSDAPPRQFFPDMDDQPKWEPQGGSEFFADGRMMRQPVAGTVAFGRMEFDLASYASASWASAWTQERTDLLKEDSSVYRGQDAKGEWLVTAPVSVDRAVLERGQERFNIYCSACHGYEGDGKGMVGTRWSYPVPNFHDEKYSDASQPQGRDGYLFHVVRNGVVGPDGAQKMPGYAHAVGERDAWAIVVYMRALQDSKRGTLEDVPEAQRRGLADARASSPSAAPGAGPGSTSAGSEPGASPAGGGSDGASGGSGGRP